MHKAITTLVLAMAISAGANAADQDEAVNPQSYPALQKKLVQLEEENQSLRQQVASLQAEVTKLKADVSEAAPASKPTRYTNEPKVGMTEQEARDCINPDDYTITERKTKGIDRILDVKTHAGWSGVTGSFGGGSMRGADASIYRTVYISKISGKVYRVVKPTQKAR